MKKQHLLLCVSSALLGGLLAVAFQNGWPWPGSAAAQDAPPAVAEGAKPPPRAAARPLDELAHLTPEERVNVRVYEQANRGVVNINTKTIRADAFFDFAFEVPSEGSGSGAVLDKQGHILTNHHVVDDARQILVTLYDGGTHEAKLVGADPNNDVAVIRIDAPPRLLHPIPYGNSQRLRVGQKVYAIGNPFGLERTLSTGVISSLNRTLKSRNRRIIKSIIQIDAAINPGNSGGPLLDSSARMIGVNTAIATNTGQSAGVGFAISAGTIARIVPQLIANGRVIRADIGIGSMLEREGGLLVRSLVPKGPAEEAGLKGFQIIIERRRQGGFIFQRRRIDHTQADLITAVNGKPVKSEEEFRSLIESHKPGETVRVTVIREGKEVTVPVRLGDEG